MAAARSAVLPVSATDSDDDDDDDDDSSRIADKVGFVVSLVLFYRPRYDAVVCPRLHAGR